MGKKPILSVLTFILFSVSGFSQTTYYYDGSGNLNSTANWGTNTNGTGTAPANFTANNQIFQIRNTTSVSMGNNWTVSGTGSKIVIGDASVAALTVTHSGGDWNATVDIAAASSGTNTLDLAQTDANTPTLGTLNGGSTVIYSRGGTQSVQSKTYGNLTIGGSSGTKTASGAISVNGTLTINPSRVFNMSTFALDGTLTPAGTGTLQTSNTTSTPIPANEVWTGTVTYASASGQTIVSGTYPTLTASGGTRTFSSTGTIIISGTFTPGASNYTIGTSTVRYTTASANIAVPAVASGGNYYNLEISSGTWAMPSALTVANNFTVNGGTFNMNNATSNALTVNGNVVVSSGKLDLNIGASGTSTLNVKGNFTVSGTGITTTEGTGAPNGTINFNGTGTVGSPQTISYTTPTNNIYVNFAVASGTVVQMNSNVGLSLWTASSYYGTMTVNSGGTLNMQDFSFVDETSFSTTGNNTVVVNSGGSVITSHTSGLPGNLSSANTISSLSSSANYEFRGAITGAFTTTPTANTVNNFTVNRSAGVTLSQAFTISGVLTFTSGALLLNGTTLTLNGSISGTSSFTGSSTSSIVIGGTGSIGSNLNMTATSSSTRTLQNFTVNRASQTITLGAVMEVTGTVTVTSGTLASAGNLTLISNASGDARVAQSAGSITGNVTVQKYLPAGSSRRWLHMGSPVDGFTWNQLIDDILISGPGAGGFDVNGSGFPSAYYYTESVAGDCGPNGWNFPANVSNSVPNNRGIKFFFRGDRNPGRLVWNNVLGMVAVTLDFTGTLNQGTQAMGITYTNNGNSSWDGWNFVPNPYPSAIDWNAASGWTKTNVSGTIYVWNAQSGTYATWNGASGTNGMTNGRISMGQGFWVKATTTSPTLTMTEAVKVGTATSGFFKTDTKIPHTFRLTMIQDSVVWDDAVFNFDNTFDRSYQKETGDALKLVNSSINLWSVSSDNEALVINNYPMPQETDTVVLGMTSSNGGIFTIKFSADSVPDDVLIFLIDEYRNRVIDVRKEKEWKVLINTDSLSYALGRLKLVFMNIGQIENLFTATTISNQLKTELSWTSSKEVYTSKYELYHSTDSLHFSHIHSVNLDATLKMDNSVYSFTHNNPLAGRNFYRINKFNNKGQVVYTDIKEVLFDDLTLSIIKSKNSNWILYPVPVHNTLYLMRDNFCAADIVSVRIYNSLGQEIPLSTPVYDSNLLQWNVGDLKLGNYIMNIISVDGKKATLMFQKN
ncbi:MAG: hypothetical protein K1X81_02565 [Bacteroidia bacterium]|nr:hypothetical protein [Bacteroidia bacterium]